MAREAIARLYDVDKNSMTYVRPSERGKYTFGRIEFRAKEGKLVDLNKVHESVWATRLSRGTGSALVNLEVTVAGDVSVEEGKTKLMVTQTKTVFTLAADPQDADNKQFEMLTAALARGERIVSVSGQLNGWKGKWPAFLNKPRPSDNRIFVTGFETGSSP